MTGTDLRPLLVVCGATGFIGRNLLNHFVRTGQYRVRAVWHQRKPAEVPDVEWVQADLTQDEDVRRVLTGATIVVQAAATTSGAGDIVARPYIHTTDNAVMNSLILRACYDLEVADFLFFSCSIMYQSGAAPVKETDFDASVPLEPRYFAAGWTKIYIEKMCEFYAGLGRTRCTVLRHSNIYGPHDKFDLKRSHVFGATVTKVMTAPDDGAVTVWGTGEEARDFLYIDDFVNCVDLCMTPRASSFRLYNVGFGSAVSVRDLVHTIITLSGRTLTVEYDTTRPTIPFALSLECSRIEADLGWSPSISLEEGVRRAIEWWKNNKPVLESN